MATKTPTERLRAVRALPNDDSARRSLRDAADRDRDVAHAELTALDAEAR